MAGFSDRPYPSGKRSDESFWPCYIRCPLSPTDLSLTSIIPAGNTGEHAKLPESQASKSSGASSQASRLPKASASRATFANGSTYCGLANNGPLQIIRGQPWRQCYWRSNLKRSGFDPITEIIRKLFRFHSGGASNLGNAKDFRQILQALNCQGDTSPRKAGFSKRLGEFRQWEDLLRIGD